MPRIPQHERNMLNYIDQQLTAEIAVWRIVKSGWFDKVKALKKAFDSALDMQGESSDLLIKGEDEPRLKIDLFDLLNRFCRFLELECRNTYPQIQLGR
ncbi:hypothetical protein L4D77_28455 [Photobacterium frigidiphilum]|uniref:hypothetical protein n=1 Tax=Photobacterium frigidiphilum TaxID=264736 RepID=UPI003D13D7D7